MTLADLRPNEKLSVHELLARLGFHLESWAVDQNSRPIVNPAVNGRAFEWSFEDVDSGQHVFMLWYEEMEEIGKVVRYRQNWSSVVRELDRVRPRTAARADSFLRHVSRLQTGSIVRVGIVEGSRSQTVDDDASRVSRRSLDEEPWHLSFWDPLNSTFEFTRGTPDVPKPSESIQWSGGNSSGVASNGTQSQLEIDVKTILEANISPTEREQLISARLGQGRFRDDVLARWANACAVTGSPTLAVIRASHCKPWRSSSDRERLDGANGLPLVATLDALFDAGLITFEDDGNMLISRKIAADLTLSLRGLHLRRPLRADELPYIEYHRRRLFVTG